MTHALMMSFPNRLLIATLVGVVVGSATGTSVLAADLAAPPVLPAVSVVAPDFFSTMTHTEQFDGGIAVNPDHPGDHDNFGQTFSDKPNQPELNQLLITVARPVDAAKTYDLGFSLQGIYGSDSRYAPTLGLLSYAIKDRNQFAFLQANIVVHSPFIGGTTADTKIGFLPGLMGYETTDPSTRPFYSYSYVSNFLLPYNHTGIETSIHVNPTLDLYAQIDTGSETTFGINGDQNSEPAAYFGFGLNNLLDNKLTVLAISRVGPEDSRKLDGTAFFGPGQNANNTIRYWNDITLTYKATDKWTFVGEANYFKDEAIGYGTAYGFVGYASYALSDEITLNSRAEVYRDTTGFVTTGWASNTAFLDTLAGNPGVYTFSGGPTTYGAITGGFAYKPNWINKAQKYATVTIRPEVRYDTTFGGTKPFDATEASAQTNGTGTKSDQFLFSTDIIVAF